MEDICDSVGQSFPGDQQQVLNITKDGSLQFLYILSPQASSVRWNREWRENVEK